MNEEIKEILDKLQEISNYAVIYNIKINSDEAKILLDYITNLQQEKEDYKERFNLMAKFRNKALERELIYKSKCEKAIELYKNCKEEDYCILSVKMYEILNGDDEK